MKAPPETWRRLCGKAVALTGQTAFQHEARILQRLVRQFGPEETERMLEGARLLRWTTLRSLGSAEGLGRRWALERYWQETNRAPSRLASLGDVLQRRGLVR